MTNTETYFKRLREAAGKFYRKQSELRERKKEIVKDYGYDSEQYTEWKKEYEALEYPLTRGATKALTAWRSTTEYKEAEFEMNDALWDEEIEDFLNTLREAEVESFIYTNQSTLVMENLHSFAAAGCTIEGLANAVRTENRYGEIEQVEHHGVKVKVN